MRRIRATQGLGALFVAIVMSGSAATHARADPLAEFLFWDAMGDQVGDAVRSYDDYQRERQLWRDKIAAAREELENCGGCASAQEELDKWQGVENRFQDVAGGLAQSVGMPPVVANWLGIDMPLGVAPPSRFLMEDIVRPEWFDDRPAYCKASVDAHLNCLRNIQDVYGPGRIGIQEGVKSPDWVCYDTYKLYDFCARQDYDGYAQETVLRQTRAEGAIIAEYVRQGTHAAAYYGEVPDDFVPPMAPPEVILATLEEEGVLSVDFTMNRPGSGALRKASVEGFIHTRHVPYTRCLSLDAPTDEIGIRVCEDLRAIRFQYGDPPVLGCYYGDPRKALPDALYWYNERPDVPPADPANLLQRSSNHPLLKIGEARTECPATLDQANKIAETYAMVLASLGIEQIPGSVILDDRLEREKQAREHREAMDRRLETIRNAMRDFPMVGTYDLTLFEGTYDQSKTTIGHTTVGRCLIINSINSIKIYHMTCDTQDGGLLIGEGIESGDRGLLMDMRMMEDGNPRSIKFAFFVDFDDLDQEGGGSLVAMDHETTVMARLVRTGDIVRSINDLPLGGSFDLDLSNDGVTLSAACTIEPSASGIPVTCTTQDGERFDGFGNLRSDISGVMTIASWDPRPIMVNGRNVSIIEVVVDPRSAARGDERLTLVGVSQTQVGFAGGSVSVRLVRTDGADELYLSAAELKALLIGRTIEGEYAGWTYRMTYRDDGTCDYTTDGGGSTCRWSIEPNTGDYCDELDSACWKAWREGDTLHWTDGRRTRTTVFVDVPQDATVQATAKPGAPDSVAAAEGSEPIVLMGNRWREGQYLNIESGSLESGPIEAGWSSARWVIEPVAGTSLVRLRNYGKPTDYIHIEHGTVESGPASPGWWSAMWTLEPVTGTSYVRIQNRWKSDQYLHVQNGAIESGPIDSSWWSAMWIVDTPQGAPDAMVERVAAAIDGSLSGLWSGYYVCQQGRTTLDLTLQDLGDGSIWGIFAFSAPPENPRVPNGSFYVFGSYDGASGQFVLKPGDWIEQPRGFTGVGLTGRHMVPTAGAGSAAKLQGMIQLASCAEFDVERMEEATTALGPIPPTVQAQFR